MLYIMAFPTVAFLLLFCYVPMGGLTLAFQKYNVATGIFGSPFIGIKNFEYLFSTTDAYEITRNTVLYNLAFIAVNTCLAVVLSILLSELTNRRTAKLYQTIYMLPYFLSWAVVTIIGTAFLDRDMGLINQIIRALGDPGKTDWYRQRELWPPLLVGVNAWKNVGYTTVLYLAVISGISEEYYEAAVIDGAHKLQQALYITLPHLRMVISITLIMAMGNILRGDFGLFFLVTKDTGRIQSVTNVIDTYIYRGLLRMSDLGISAAAGFYQSTVGLVMVFLTNWVVTKIDPDCAMF